MSKSAEEQNEELDKYLSEEGYYGSGYWCGEYDDEDEDDEY